MTSVNPDYVTARVGDMVEIHCSSTGHPQPRVEWTQGPQGELSSDVYAEDGLLRFRAVGKEQEGVYECRGSNSFGSTSATSFVVIEGTFLLVLLSRIIVVLQSECIDDTLNTR